MLNIDNTLKKLEKLKYSDVVRQLDIIEKEYGGVFVQHFVHKLNNADLISHYSYLKDEEMVMYLFINKDLNMSTGKIATQSARVSEILSTFEKDNSNSLFVDSLNELSISNEFHGNKIITVSIKEKDFEKYRLTSFDTEYEVNFYFVKDSGLNEVGEQSLTAMMCTPIKRKDIPKSFKRLRLL